MITEIVKDQRILNFGRLRPDELDKIEKLYVAYIKANTSNDGRYFGSKMAISDYTTLLQYIERAKQSVKKAA